MIRSIRLTLTLWYVGILAVILCLFGWVLYRSVESGLAKDVDTALALQAEGVAHAILAFWEAERAAPGSAPGNWKDSPSESIGTEVRRGRLPGLVARWAQGAQALDSGHAICVMDARGRVMAESANFVQPPEGLRAYAEAEARRGRTVYNTFALSHGRVRIVTRPVMQGRQVLYLVQMAASLTQADASLRRLRLWLLWLVPLTLAVTSAVGWFLAKQALRPVGQMITQAQRISVESLHERVVVPSSSDELERLAATFNDMLGRLERAFKRLRQFSAAASHELRTPLTVMKGELEVALRRPRASEEYRRVLRTHLEATDQMTVIVEELLMLARSEAAEEALEWRPVELGALAQRAVGLWQAVAQRKAVRVECRANGPAWVRGEQRLLERVVANLLDNAIRHSPAEGTVVVRVEPRGAEACLVVQDAGPGILAEELSQIFERFFQPWSKTNGARSTGIGLGLCRWIAEAHHGHIQASSVPGHGATFTVWLPLIAPPV